ncbi:RagB/SusD family nutrient uptake outer membrane protein, partial [Prevotella sp.]
IENEWFRETVGEGLRISCLKRWGKGYSARYAQPTAEEKGATVTGDYFEKRAMSADDIHWVWPIPAYEIKVNPNLENEQNPGY